MGHSACRAQKHSENTTGIHYCITQNQKRYTSDPEVGLWERGSLGLGSDSDSGVALDFAALFPPQHPAPSAFGPLWTRSLRPRQQSAPAPPPCARAGRGRAAGTARPPSQSPLLCCWRGSGAKLWLPPASRLARPLWSREECCTKERKSTLGIWI